MSEEQSNPPVSIVVQPSNSVEEPREEVQLQLLNPQHQDREVEDNQANPEHGYCYNFCNFSEWVRQNKLLCNTLFAYYVIFFMGVAVFMTSFDAKIAHVFHREAGTVNERWYKFKNLEISTFEMNNTIVLTSIDDSHLHINLFNHSECYYIKHLYDKPTKKEIEQIWNADFKVFRNLKDIEHYVTKDVKVPREDHCIRMTKIPDIIESILLDKFIFVGRFHKIIVQNYTSIIKSRTKNLVLNTTRT